MTNENGYNNGFENNEGLNTQPSENREINNKGINNGGEADMTEKKSTAEPFAESASATVGNGTEDTTEASEPIFELLGDNPSEGTDFGKAQGSDEAFEDTAPEAASEAVAEKDSEANTATDAASEAHTAPNYASAAGERTYFGPATDSQPYGNTYGRGDSAPQSTYSAPRTNTNPYSAGNNAYGNNAYGNNPYGNNPNGSNAYGNNPNGSNAYGNTPNGNNAYGNAPYGNSPYGNPPRKETAGIRYDADRKTGGGAYTWNYSQEPSNTVTAKRRSPEKARKSGHGAFIAVMLVFAVLATAAVSSIVTYKFIGTPADSPALESEAGKPVIGQNGNGSGSGNTENVVSVPAPGGDKALTKQQIAEKCKPSSVGIETTVTTQSYFGYSYKTGGVGSGFILTSDGYIATNHHVIEGADSITVQLDDGTKHEATLVGSDSITDLAVLKIEATDLIPMEIGDSDKMVVGDSVIAIGTPAGIEFAGTVTDGIISAINRGIEITNERGTVVKTMTLMQTNAAINPGNSGGPLINDRGEVIGINTLKLTSTYEGIGFSIPINSAVAIFNQLITDGKVSDYDSSFVTGNGAIGITNYVEIGEEEAAYYNYPVGIVILALDIDSSAYKAGLRRYDTITAFEGTTVKTVAELNKLKAAYKAGDEVTLTVSRDGAGEMDITFKLDLMG